MKLFIDTGLTNTGFVLIKNDSIVHYGQINLENEIDKISSLYYELNTLIENYKPQAVSIEKITGASLSANSLRMMIMAYTITRCVILQHSLTFNEYTNKELKKTIRILTDNKDVKPQWKHLAVSLLEKSDINIKRKKDNTIALKYEHIADAYCIYLHEKLWKKS